MENGTASYGLARSERLRGQRCVGRIFAEGRSGFVFPCRYHYLIDRSGGQSAAMMISVPKKMFKRAVKRNLFKRRTREAYRLEKHLLVEASDGVAVSVAFVYATRDEVGFDKMRSSMRRILTQLAAEVRWMQNETGTGTSCGEEKS